MNGYAKISTAMVLWGTVGLFVVWSGLDSITISLFRCLIGAGILLITLRGINFAVFKRYSLSDYSLMIMGGGCLIYNWVFLFKSFQLASITLGNISYYTQPIFLVLLGILFFDEKVSARKWCYILLTFAGIILTINIKPADLSLSNNTLLGAFYALLAGLLYAVATIIVKKQKHINVQHITIVQLLSGIILLIPFVNFNYFPSQAVQWQCIAIIGVVHTAIAYLLYYSAVKKVNVTAVAVLSYIDPIVAILTDILFFNRQLDLIQWFGIFLTLWASYRVLNIKVSHKLASHHSISA